MKTGSKTKKQKASRSIGILPSMLIVFVAALLICISLTILVFSLLGTSVYAKLKAREMLPQLRSIAASSADYMQGSKWLEELFLLTRTSEATLVILDENGSEYLFHDPKMREMREEPIPDELVPDEPIPDEPLPDGKPGEMPGPGPGFDGKPDKPLDEWNDPEREAIRSAYVKHCMSIFPEVLNASENDEYTSFDTKVGVVVAMPIENEGKKIGAAYLITPLNDLTEASRSVVLALVISAAFVALVMIPLLFLFVSRLTKPIKKMTGAALALAEGDFSQRARIAGSTEVRELGESFNTLADNLRHNIGDLVVERNRLRAILDGMSEGIIGTDASGGDLQYNNAALRLLGGRDNDELQSLPCFPEVLSALNSALEGQSAASSLACGERNLRVSASPILEENGAVAGSVALIMDVTEAERLEQTRRDYVANVSHELRTPLASIRGIADMLNDGLVKKESDKLRYYGYIQKESIRLSNLINDLLELSRLQSGGVALEMRRVELYELVFDVADRMSDAAAENGMSIKILVPEGEYYAHTNADRVEQVLVSLTDNAVKHGVPGGTVGIGIEPHDEKWHVYVENPAEVDPNDIDHLFERFYKADVAHTGEGTGLGLAITREVTELMGERIWTEYDNGVIRFTFTADRV